MTRAAAEKRATFRASHETGCFLPRMAWGGMTAAAEQMQTPSFNGFAGGAPGQRLNAIFSGFAD